MNVLYISGSPRKKSNTDILLKLTMSVTGGKFIKLVDYNIKPCLACWACQKEGECPIKDDMTKELIPMLLESDAIVIGSPVFFNNISGQLKAFIDRTWCIKGQLRNKIGGAIVVGRKYGHESAITAINAFFLKHDMIPANRGICGIAYKGREIFNDTEAIEATRRLGKRILELGEILGVK
ncbi:flavodoxin family protein [Caldanaerobacter subterraneus]|uniref:Flavodoxin family protein n=1 Tax=Caldanaerobacter subterraneus TaxID=911092 RepID=A0A7Y2L9C4_9THEO|nr:flavodoxin family protein [Caldanaerobacter subterraneus]NNG67597.1 flavodoxin family protein [Caldanaerobacter subterraneus]